MLPARGGASRAPVRRSSGAAALALLVLAGGAHAAPAPSAPTGPTGVVAVVGEAGINVLHQEWATPDGRSVVLPASIRRTVVRVGLPAAGDFEDRLAALRRGPLGTPRPGTLYYVEGTRLLVYNDGSRPPEDFLADFHGTAVTSLTVGRSVGSAPRALAVAVIGAEEPSWNWVAKQDWIDIASASTFEIFPGGVLCNSAAAVTSFRASGRLPLAAAGNSATDTTAVSPGGHPSVVRVGGVEADGASAVPDSGRAYDVAELFTNRVAGVGADDRYQPGAGTSGSSPRVAGRIVDVLQRVRQATRSTGSGVRSGSLVLVGAGQRRPSRGPLTDGRLDGEELLVAVLSTARPKGAALPGRYSSEGFGWFDDAAADAAVDVILGRTAPPPRTQDDLEHGAALVLRRAAYRGRGCTTG